MKQLRRLAAIGLPFCMAIMSSAPAWAGCNVRKITAFEVKMDTGEPVTTGAINGHPVQLVIQSGSFYSFISTEVAREAGLNVKPISNTVDISGLSGKSIPTGRAYIDELTLAGPSMVKGVNFLVGGKYVGLSGMIGQNILARTDIEYDFQHGAVRFMRADNCLGGNPAYWAGTRPFFSLPLKPMDDLYKYTEGTVLLNGTRFQASFDSGANLSMISLKAAKRLGVTPGSKGTEKGPSLSDAEGNGFAGYRAKFASLDIGGEKLRDVTFEVVDLGETDTDVIIGMEFFRTHRIYVANEMHRMNFTYEGGEVFGVTPPQ